jgi:hypothetical protein
MIPRVLHQTGPTPLPDWMEQYRRTLWDHHPTWQYRFWTDNDLLALVREHYLWLLPLYEKCAIIQQADLGRYCVLHRHGGVYCDTDMYWRGSLDTVLGESDELWLAHSPKTLPTDRDDSNKVTNYLMASPHGHPFWLEVLQEAGRRMEAQKWPWWALNQSLRVTYTTGAYLLSSVAQQHPVRVFQEPLILNLFCAQTEVPAEAVGVHNGGTSRTFGSSSWSGYVKLVKHECKLRQAFGVRGNLCQFPHCSALLYGVLLAVLVVLGAVLGWWCGRWARWRKEIRIRE